MSGVVAKIQRLIALAVNQGAEDAEARTAAYVAARLIHAHGIELCAPAERPSVAPPTKVIRSGYAGRCNICGRGYDEGELVVWTKGRGAAHTSCTEASRP